MKSILALTAVSLLFLSNVKAEGDAGATESSIEFQSLPYGSYPDLNIMGLEVNNQGKRKFLQGAQLANSGPTPTVDVDPSISNGAPPPAEVDNLEDNFLYANLPYNENTDLPVFAQRKKIPGEEYPPVPQATACRTEGQIALTFSEGPTNVTSSVSNDLKTMGVRGSFFVNVKDLGIKQSQDIVKNVYQDGHLIGLTYRTPQDEPGTLTDDEIAADIIKSAETVKSLINVYPKYVRLHINAQADKRTEHIMDKLGFILINHSLDSKDYLHKATGDIIGEFSNKFKSYKTNFKSIGSFISVQYDIPQTHTSTAMKSILELLKNEHFEPVRIDGCLNDKTPYKTAADKKEYTGDKFSFGSPDYISGFKPTVSASVSQEKKEPQPTGVKIGNSEPHDESNASGVAENEEQQTSSGSSPVSPELMLYFLVPATIHTLINLF